MSTDNSQHINLWSFAIDVYGQDGVEKACLQLQDNYAVDIPLLLFCCWVSRRQGVISSEQARQSLELAQLWRSYCIQPLRDTRRQMKVFAPVGATAVAWMEVREQVKAAELTSEKSLLEGLQALAGTVHAGPDVQPLSDIALANIDRCIGLPSLASKPAMAAIATILCAAYPDLQYHALIESMRVLTAD